MDPLEKAVRDYVKGELAKHVGFSSGSMTEESIQSLVTTARDFLAVRRAKATFVVFGDQPMPRLKVKLGKRERTIDGTGDPLVAVFGRLPHPVYGPDLARAVELAADPAELALARAACKNAVAAASVDEHKVGPIKEKLAKRRELDRLRSLENLKLCMRTEARNLTEDDVLRTWREVMVSGVMES